MQRVFGHFRETALADLRRVLLHDLSGLCAAALYERFAKARKEARRSTSRRDGTIALRSFRRRHESRRLSPPVRRQAGAVAPDGDADAAMDRHVARIRAAARCRSAGDPTAISSTAAPPAKSPRSRGELSDPHNGGHSVLIVTFDDGARVVYKPKDLRLDVVWHDLIERLNRADPPVALKAVRAIARDGYGWTEFIAHTGCADRGRHRAIFPPRRRLARAVSRLRRDRHASGEHDRCTAIIRCRSIWKPSCSRAPRSTKSQEPEGEAFDAAMDIVGNSVMTVGLLPAYGRSVDNNVFAMGGMTADWGARTVITWNDINSDAMRPAKQKEAGDDQHRICRMSTAATPNSAIISTISSRALPTTRISLPRCMPQSRPPCSTVSPGLPVRKVVRPTRFYYMLLQRLRNHQHDGRRRDLVGASRLHRAAFAMGQGDRPAVAAAARRTRGARCARTCRIS